MAQTVKNLPAMRETSVYSLGWEDPLEDSMATHSSSLAWKIPMDRGAWQTTVHGVTKSRTWLSNSAHITTKMYVKLAVSHFISGKTKAQKCVHTLFKVTYPKETSNLNSGSYPFVYSLPLISILFHTVCSLRIRCHTIPVTLHISRCVWIWWYQSQKHFRTAYG